MDDSDCTVGGVDVLASSSTGSLCLNLQILWIYGERNLTVAHNKHRLQIIYDHYETEMTGQLFHQFTMKQYLSWLGQYSHRHGASVHSALLFSLGNPLNPMDSCLKLHPLVALRAADAGWGMTQSTWSLWGQNTGRTNTFKLLPVVADDATLLLACTHLKVLH